MPHEVIMPALGMAQETGLIVSWLKQKGDAVAEGEPLMEVETDKATMEVEAQASGYLTEIRAEAGASVPVGQPVAVISDRADLPVEATGAVDAANAAEPKDLPAGHEVIMPALGMAQDSGLIVAWHQSLGAEVSEGDVLLEVETDKATMEVPADRRGYLAAILAEAGDDVPVGQTIAVLSQTAPTNPVRRALAADAPAPPRKPAPLVADPAPKAPPPPKPQVAPQPGGRILASPKARRLAAEEGLDLADLVAAGHPQPYHVADLEILRGLAKPATPVAAPAASPSETTADIPAAAYDAFRAWLAAEHDAPPTGPRLLAAFATGALRAATAETGPISVAVAATGPLTALTDADLAPLAADLPRAEDAPRLHLRDLTETALTGHRPSAATTPTLTLTRRGDTLKIHLIHDEAALGEEAALALVAGLAARLAEPLRHLL